MCKLKVIKEMEEKHCKKCQAFIDNMVCKYELDLMKQKNGDVYQLMYNRQDVCSLDKEPKEIRQFIYKGLENEGKLFDLLPSSKTYEETKRYKKSKFFDL